ncbi:PaaI family thioesterase [Micromonospora aurantiaca]|uniref:PaaI family thioesterase n=1 Tax=Micromonospora aurantiaca (nom. illeg.) TaxID=47850 RepID=A0A1C6SN43_9ACTN|nr:MULTISPECIES: PaaI family thioesterase [Micromonospora]ADL45845.1 thioesterase superfamily protein [Micromonospora aurantiaca ATCC 27029]ADU07935.1 thioesterase superfamily protein [Micromonospora sp. L5]AXH91899.1 PaaI family thioesterase [Micromonospora aurantiaca]MBC9001886.1 PaaI family thioesterase [Micromonospora aurantiaca]OHX03052.1 aromatic compound degradation protein PaaI [Micromonospora sp. WMMB235]
MTQTQERTRTFTWSDPAAGAAHLGRRSGLELMQAMIAGELDAPPIMHLVDMSRMEAEEGRVAVELLPQEFHYNPLGTVHGGVISTLLDTAAACAVHTTLPAGVGYTSLDLNVKFLRPVTVDTGTLRCEGTVLQRGRRTALAEARLTDPAGRLVAHATSTCLIFPLP